MKSKRSTSLADSVYSTIKRAIVNRELPPGTKLSEETLVTILNVSRTPIRSALQKLSYEKLVTINPRKGTMVAYPTEKEVLEVFEMRKLLEDYTVTKACQNAEHSVQVIKDLEEILMVEKKAYGNKDMEGVLEQVLNFHIKIAALSDNSLILRNLQETIALTNIYITFYSEMDINEPNSPEEHLKIFEAIKIGDVKTAKERMRAHIEGIENRLNFNKIKPSNEDLADILLKNKAD